MKKLFLISICTAILAISSCDKYLDVKPKFVFGENLAISNLEGLSSAMVGAFSKLQSSNLYGGGIIAYSELWADFVYTQQPLTDFSQGQFRNHSFNGYNAQAGGMWTDGYRAILISNIVLKYLPNFEKQDPAKVALLRGQALFVRAIMHYELVRMFAQPSGFSTDDSHLGIPIRLEPGTADEGQQTARSKVSEVYAQIITDLKAAEALLPASTSSGSNSGDWATKYAAEAFIAKAYFSQNKYTEAKNYAQLVINAGYTLNDSVGTIYRDGNATAETVFQVINSQQDKDNGVLAGNFSIPPLGSTNPPYSMAPRFATLLDQAKVLGDARAGKLTSKNLFQKTGSNYFCKKYTNANQNLNVVVVRLAEMYLLYAEAAAQTGDNASAKTYLNKVRNRAGLVSDNSSIGQGLINTIRGERDLELGMEGDHYFEVKRRKGTFYCQFQTYQWNDATMIYPIPQQEVNENKLMVQNPGY